LVEIVVAVLGIVVAVLLWLFPPERLRKRLGLEESESRSVHFLIRSGEQSAQYWGEVDEPLKPNMISLFQENCSKFFQISFNNFVDDVDPSFDITLINEMDSTVVFYELGVEILSIAHEMKFYGSPQTSKVLQQASYTIEIPDIRADIELEIGRFPRLLEPRNINMPLSIREPDPFRLEPGGTFRYELLLKNYVAHMPNHAVLRFWIMTQRIKYTSELIHVFTF
jgi:hypothetical protein